jgi:MFS family permease
VPGTETNSAADRAALRREAAADAISAASPPPADDSAAPPSEISSTLRIIATAILSFACYLTIGMQLAVVPSFVHLTLHYGAVVAGLAVSVQYVATLASRPFAGHTSDTKGAKRATASGLCSIIASSALFITAVYVSHNPAASLIALCVSRLILGFGESWVATGGALWGIARMGDGYEAKVISWNGVGSYGGMAVGAPLGVLLESHFGLEVMGLTSVGISIAAVLWAIALPRVATYRKPPLAFAKVLKKVSADGLGLALGGIGFGTIAAFITLFYASRNWPDASLSLTLFGAAFVAARLLFAWTINRWGGYPVAIVSLIIEAAGLLVLWLAPVPVAAKIGAAVSGFGFSLVFPALGVEAVRKTPVESRGSALAIYTAFIDLSMGLAGPIAGAIASAAGFPRIFLFAAAASALGILLVVKLQSSSSARQDIPAAG